jgi:hypothetical protein
MIILECWNTGIVAGNREKDGSLVAPFVLLPIIP